MVNRDKLNKNRNWKQIFRIIYLGLCPSCGEGKLFNSFIRVKEKCPNCTYSINHNDIGDVAIWFSMLITSIIVAFSALYFELSFKPSLWVHIFVWIPIIFTLVFITLRFFKIIFIYINYIKRV